MADDRRTFDTEKKSLWPKAPPNDGQGVGGSVQPKTDLTTSENRPAMPPADED